MNRSFLKSGDVVGFYEEKFGYLSISSSMEPLPEQNEKISHLRVLQTTVLSPDFWDRCLFQLFLVKQKVNETNQNDDICFGSIVNIKHYPSQYLISATNVEHLLVHPTRDSSLNSCLIIGKEPWEGDAMVSRWKICSRFKIRLDGEQVRDTDFITLKNMRYRNKIIMPYPISDSTHSTIEAAVNSMIVSYPADSNEAKQLSGWKIKLIRHSVIDQANDDNNNTILFQYGNFLKIFCLETPRKHLIARLDDERELTSRLNPLGLACHKISTSNADNNVVCVRKFSEDVNLKEIICLQSIWQILPSPAMSLPLRNVFVNDLVYFRHAQTGLFLSIRAISGNNKSNYVMLSTEPSSDCLFYIRSIDVDQFSENTPLLNSEKVFLEHNATRAIIQLDSSGISIRQTSLRSNSQGTESKYWWEYKDDMPVVIGDLDQQSSQITSAICRLEVIGDEIIQEVLYVKRFIPVAKMTLERLRGSKIEDFLLPIFRHLFNSMYALAKWTVGDIDSDGFIANYNSMSYKVANPLDQNIVNIDHEDFSVKIREPTDHESFNHNSSLIHWIPQLSQFINFSVSLTPSFQNFDYDNKYFSEKVGHIDVNFENEKMIRRRKLVADSRVVDVVLQFVQTIHVMARAEENKLLKDSEFAAMNEIDSLPSILYNCCEVIQDLVLVTAFDHPFFAVRFLSLSGNLFAMINQKIFGKWNPPIKTILVSVEPLLRVVGKSSLMANLPSLINDAISVGDIQHIVDYMYVLRSKGDARAFQILNVLSTISFPGNINNRRFQECILFTLTSAPSTLVTPDIEVASSPQNPLLVTRFNPNAGSGDWEVSLNPEYSLRSSSGESIPERELSIIDENEIHEELDYLVAVLEGSIFSNDKDDSLELSERILHPSNARQLLESLGFGLYILEIELGYLDGVDFWGLWRWWYGRRLMYFPGEGNLLSATDTAKYLGLEINKSLFGEIFHFMTNRSSLNKLPSIKVPYPLKLFSPRTTTGRETKDVDETIDLGASGKTVPVELFISWKSACGANDVSGAKLFDRHWLYQCLELIISLSRGRHLNAQYFASSILPVECILTLLEDQTLRYDIKRLLYEFLSIVYLDHDYVFRLRFSVSTSKLSYCSNNDEDILDSIPFGKVFNSRSRMILNGSQPDTILRQKFWKILMRGIYNLTFLQLIEVDGYQNYALSFLRCINQLVRNDYFSDKTADPYSDTEDTNSQQSDNNSGCFGIESILFPQPTQRFDIFFLGKSLLEKLSNFFNHIDSKRNPSKSVTEHDTADEGEEYQKVNEQEDDSTVEPMQNVTGDELYKRLEVMFSDETLMSIIYEIVTILSEIENNRTSIYIYKLLKKIIDDKTFQLVLKFSRKQPFNAKTGEIFVSSKKLTSYLIAHPIMHANFVQKLNDTLINCFLFNKDDNLHKPVMSFMHNICQTNDRTGSAVKYLLQKANILDTLTTIHDLSEYNHLAEAQRLISIASTIVHKHVVEVSTALISKSSSTAVPLSSRVDILISSMKILLTALYFDFGLPGHKILSNKDSKLINHEHLVKSDDDLIGIELTSPRLSEADIPSLRQSQHYSNDSSNYSDDYESSYAEKNFPHRLNHVLLQNISKSIKLISNALNFCLHNLFEENEQRLSYDRSNPKVNSYSGQSPQLDDDYSPKRKAQSPVKWRLKVFEPHNDSNLRLEENISEIESQSSTLHLSPESKKQASIESYMKDVNQKQIFLNSVIQTFRIIESACELLKITCQYNKVLAIRQYSQWRQILIYYLYFTNSFASDEKFTVLEPYKVFDLLKIFSRIVDFDDEMEKHMMDHIDKVIEKFLAKYVNGNGSVSNPHEKEVRLEISIFSLVSSLLSNGSFDFFDTRSKKYEAIASIMELHTSKICEIVLPVLVAVGSSKNTQSLQSIGSSRLFSEIINSMIAMSTSNISQINGFSSALYFSFPPEKCLSFLSNSDVLLTIKAQIVTVSTMLYDHGMVASEKFILYELRKIKEALSPSIVFNGSKTMKDEVKFKFKPSPSPNPKPKFVFTHREYIVYGAIRSLCWRMMTYTSYSVDAVCDMLERIAQLHMDKLQELPLRTPRYLRHGLRVEVQADTSINSNLDNYNCLAPISKVLADKLSQIWYPNNSVLRSDSTHREYPLAEFFQSVLMLSTIIIENHESLRLFADDASVISDSNDIIFNVCHLLATALYMIVNMDNQSSEALSNDMIIDFKKKLFELQHSIIFHEFVTILINDRTISSEPPTIKIEVVDKIRSVQAASSTFEESNQQLQVQSEMDYSFPTTKEEKSFDAFESITLQLDEAKSEENTSAIDEYTPNIRNTLFFTNIEARLSKAVKYNILSKSKSLKPGQLSIFEKWTEGGLRIFRNMIKYLGDRILDSSSVSSSFLQMFIDLLEDNVNKIRSQSRLSLSTRKVLVDKDILRLKGLQDALSACDISKLIIVSISSVQDFDDQEAEKSVREEWLTATKIRILSLKLGSSFMRWGNRNSQDNIMCKLCIQDKELRNCLDSLQDFMRKLRNRIDLATNVSPTSKASAELPYLLEDVLHIFQFLSSLCEGYYDKGKMFLMGKSGIVSGEINMVKEIVDVMISLLTLVARFFHYIHIEPFASQLAPIIWLSKGSVRRPFIAWHHRNNNFPLLIEIFHVLSAGFDTLVRVNNDQVLGDIFAITQYCPKLLKYVGLLQLKATSVVPSNGIISDLLSTRVAKWVGGNPFLFYEVYVKELSNLRALDKEPDIDFILRVVNKNMNPSSASPNKLDIGTTASQKSNALTKFKSSSRSGGSKFANMQSLWGVQLNEFHDAAYSCELNCLRLLTSMLENSTGSTLVTAMPKIFDIGILFQNMNSYFEQAAKKDEYSTAAVLYVSFLSSISISHDEIRRLLQDWQGRIFKGRTEKSRVASIEIVGPDGQLQRLYYPIPNFVRKYWGYPEVVKAKEHTLYNVNRNSPEEKFDDFRRQSSGIVLVMQRQRHLRTFLTPFIHQFVGGKNMLGSNITAYFPSQKICFLTLTLAFNVYFIYVDSTPSPQQFPYASQSQSYRQFRRGLRKYCIVVLQIFHICLAGLLAIRYILNSRAADNLPKTILLKRFREGGSSADNEDDDDDDDDDGDGDGKDNENSAASSEGMSSLFDNVLVLCILTILDWVLLLMLQFYKLFEDSWWPIAVVAFSYLGYRVSVWFYALCILDIVFVFPLLSFLVIAIQRNIGRIGFTVLMAIIFLYLFAIANYSFFRNQYSLDGYSGCNNLLACLKLHVDYGLNSSPTWLGDSYIKSSISYFGNSIYGIVGSRVIGTFYNIAYIVIVNLVLQAIISGLIIDTFSTMRQENEDIEEDIRSNCFMCSISKDDFEKAGLSFRTHVREEHNMWKYIWFKLYLDFKDPLSYSRPEHYAAEMMNSDNGYIKILPNKKSLSLQLANSVSLQLKSVSKALNPEKDPKGAE